MIFIVNTTAPLAINAFAIFKFCICYIAFAEVDLKVKAKIYCQNIKIMAVASSIIDTETNIQFEIAQRKPIEWYVNISKPIQINEYVFAGSLLRNRRYDEKFHFKWKWKWKLIDSSAIGWQACCFNEIAFDIRRLAEIIII